MFNWQMKPKYEKNVANLVDIEVITRLSKLLSRNGGATRSQTLKKGLWEEQQIQELEIIGQITTQKVHQTNEGFKCEYKPAVNFCRDKIGYLVTDKSKIFERYTQ